MARARKHTLTPEILLEEMEARLEESVSALFQRRGGNKMLVRRWKDEDAEWGRRYDALLLRKERARRQAREAAKQAKRAEKAKAKAEKPKRRRRGRPRAEEVPGQENVFELWFGKVQQLMREEGATRPYAAAARWVSGELGIPFSASLAMTRIDPKSSRYDPEFAARFQEMTRAELRARALDGLYTRLGNESERARDFLLVLERLDPEEFGDKRKLLVEGSVKHDHRHQIELRADSVAELVGRRMAELPVSGDVLVLEAGEIEELEN